MAQVEVNTLIFPGPGVAGIKCGSCDVQVSFSGALDVLLWIGPKTVIETVSGDLLHVCGRKRVWWCATCQRACEEGDVGWQRSGRSGQRGRHAEPHCRRCLERLEQRTG